MKSKSLSRNGNYVERGIGEDAALNKSNVEVDFGNLIWVQLNGQSWLGQIVDEKVVGGNKKPTKKVAGEVLVRLYGSCTYLYVDPIKSQLEYEKIIKRYHGSLVNVLHEALKQRFFFSRNNQHRCISRQRKQQKSGHDTLNFGNSFSRGICTTWTSNEGNASAWFDGSSWITISSKVMRPYDSGIFCL